LSKKSFVQGRPFAVLGILLLVWLLLPAVLKSWLRLSFFEMQAPALTAVSYVRDIQDYWALRTRSKTELIEGIRDLSRLNAAYELRLNETDFLRREITHLEQLLGLPSIPDHRYEIARVARRDMNGWWQQIVIRKGAADGIQAGAPVIFSGGVVGRVREVFANTAVVDLLSSQHLRLAAVVEGDDRPVSYQGGINQPIRTPRGMVEFIPPDIRPDGQRRLLTSGVGGVFPPGLIIGEIVSLDATPDGLFQGGTVQLDRRLNSIQEVAVLVPVRAESR
jgi:rod shape-determining protein MreC